MGVSTDGSTPRRGPPLTQERINLLNAIGFTWTIRSRDSLEESWNQRLEDLKQYKEQFGHCLVHPVTLPIRNLAFGSVRNELNTAFISKVNKLAINSSMQLP
jgi:hypothetical protein